MFINFNSNPNLFFNLKLAITVYFIYFLATWGQQKHILNTFIEISSPFKLIYQLFSKYYVIHKLVRFGGDGRRSSSTSVQSSNVTLPSLKKMLHVKSDCVSFHNAIVKPN